MSNEIKLFMAMLLLALLMSGCTEKVSDERIGMVVRSSNPAENVTIMDLHFKIIPRTEIESILLPDGTSIPGKDLFDGKTKISYSADIYTEKHSGIQTIILLWNQSVSGKKPLAIVTVRGSKNFSTYILAEGKNDKGEKIEMNVEGVRYEK